MSHWKQANRVHFFWGTPIHKLCDNDGLAESIRQQQKFSLSHKGIQNSLTELEYAWSAQRKLKARWGLLPPGESVANPFEASPHPSWLLDIDAYDEDRFEFSSEIVVGRLKALSEKAYRYFRWVFTPAALREFGALDD